jgi:hypothetical protein
MDNTPDKGSDSLVEALAAMRANHAETDRASTAADIGFAAAVAEGLRAPSRTS